MFGTVTIHNKKIIFFFQKEPFGFLSVYFLFLLLRIGKQHRNGAKIKCPRWHLWAGRHASSACVPGNSSRNALQSVFSSCKSLPPRTRAPLVPISRWPVPTRPPRSPYSVDCRWGPGTSRTLQRFWKHKKRITIKQENLVAVIVVHLYRASRCRPVGKARPGLDSWQGIGSLLCLWQLLS